jgi:Holliday junction resolvase
MGNRKGDRRERELRDLFREAEWTVHRVAGSGTAGADDLPDLFVGDGDRMLAIEAKASKRGEYIYLDLDDVRNLAGFSYGFHTRVRPLIAVRYDYGGWYVREPLPAYLDYHTDAGSVRVSEQNLDAWTPLDDLI